MYSSKENVNILTALLIKSGVKYAVLCPGSRNAPIVHNFIESGRIKCYSVTDERSAAFQAMGIRIATGCKTVVCVTSGSALLNLLPGVAESTYRRAGIIVISADRPESWIGQNDGQVLPQKSALGTFVEFSQSLPEIFSIHKSVLESEDLSAQQLSTQGARWHCERLINEALLINDSPCHPSVHINVPITEPLFEFTENNLPRVNNIRHTNRGIDREILSARLKSILSENSRPLLILGQLLPQASTPSDTLGQSNQSASLTQLESILKKISQRMPVVAEQLSSGQLGLPYDIYFSSGSHSVSDSFSRIPDVIFYAGGTFISKKLRKYFRQPSFSKTRFIEITQGPKFHDVFMRLSEIIDAPIQDFLEVLNEILVSERPNQTKAEIKAETKAEIKVQAKLQSEIQPLKNYLQVHSLKSQKILTYVNNLHPAYSQSFIIQKFENMISSAYEKAPTNNPIVHYANSMSVRLGALFARHYIYTNRGLNGIEGSLSTAVGHSLVTDQKVFCVIGDLSFLYDCNALWNEELKGNLRIILLNNQKGGIFNILPGLEKSPARDRFVSAEHHANAEGICNSFGIKYIAAHNEEEVYSGLEAIMSDDIKSETKMQEHNRGILLEVFTDPQVDEREYQRIINKNI